MSNLALTSDLEVTIIFSCLFLLVISTISTVSTVSSLASKHFYSFAHCPYHTRSASIVAYHNNTHCPQHFRPTWSMDTNPIFRVWAMTSSPPLNQWVHSYGLQVIRRCRRGGSIPSIFGSASHSYYKTE